MNFIKLFTFLTIKREITSLLMNNKTKYKFVQITGCTAFDFTANGKSLSELTKEERDEILNYLFIKIKEGEWIREQEILLQSIIQLFRYDDCEHDSNVCEQCGDTVTTMTWNI